MAKTPVLSLARISVRGVVQGVGFRPFVYQLAVRHKLRGWVCNTSEDVKIEVEGEAANIDRFLGGLHEQAPPLAHIEAISAATGNPTGYEKFEIRDSIAEAGKYQLVSPDIATCPDCLRPTLSVPFYQLHQLRAALHHHRRYTLRPPQYDHEGFPDVP